jgi:signal transduction histidine kinase
MRADDDREVAFIGRITADATHELRNVLAITKESAGLIADIVTSPDHVGTRETDKVLRTVQRIEAQVKRGSELLTSLNRFAHSLDRTADVVDLKSAVREAATLCRWVARKGRHDVKVVGDDPMPTAVVDVLGFQMAVYAAVECCLEQLPEAGTVTLQAVHDGGRPSVVFRGDVGGAAVVLDPKETTAWSRLAMILGPLGATVEHVEPEYGFRLVLGG